jgi:hypothetical protein
MILVFAEDTTNVHDADKDGSHHGMYATPKIMFPGIKHC